jgi:hypothetical protein
MVAKGRGFYGNHRRGDNHPARLIPGLHAGERNGRAKLTVAEVAALKADPRQTKLLVAAYNISPTQVRRIKRGESW